MRVNGSRFPQVLYKSVLKPGDTRAIPSQLTQVLAARPSQFTCSHFVRSRTCSGVCKYFFFYLLPEGSNGNESVATSHLHTQKNSLPKSRWNFLPLALSHLLQCWPVTINCLCWSLGFCCFAFDKRQVCSCLGHGCSVFWGWDSEFPVCVLLISVLPGRWELMAPCNETDSPNFWEHLVTNSYPWLIHPLSVSAARNVMCLKETLTVRKDRSHKYWRQICGLIIAVIIRDCSALEMSCTEEGFEQGFGLL